MSSVGKAMWAQCRGKSERREIATAGELADVLESVFGIRLPDHAAFEAAAIAKRIVPAP